MATREQVRQMQTAQPFRPFVVKLAGGRSFTVRHPENVAVSVNGREMTLYDEIGVHVIEMLLIDVIEPAMSQVAESRAEGNGS